MSTDLTTIRAELEQALALDQKATGAPWLYQPWSEHAYPSGDYAESILLSDDSPDGEVVRGLADEDGELIAAYRPLTPKLAKASQKTLERHKPSHDLDCPCGDVDPRDNYCLWCDRLYPCADVQAILDAWGGQDDG